MVVYFVWRMHISALNNGLRIYSGLKIFIDAKVLELLSMLSVINIYNIYDGSHH